jgi:hypothetical protein
MENSNDGAKVGGNNTLYGTSANAVDLMIIDTLYIDRTVATKDNPDVIPSNATISTSINQRTSVGDSEG